MGEEPDACEVVLEHPQLAADLEVRLKVVELLFQPLRAGTLPDQDTPLYLEARTWPAGNASAATTLRENGPASLLDTGQPHFLGRYQVLGRGASSVVYRAYGPKQELLDLKRRNGIRRKYHTGRRKKTCP